MAMVDGGDLVARAIKLEGVDTIFTLCGGHVQAIFDACLDEEIKVIDVRHEQVAGHAAEGWSRATRRCGVAVVTAGPGVTDCVTAIANASQNRSPVLVIGGLFFAVTLFHYLVWGWWLGGIIQAEAEADQDEG